MSILLQHNSGRSSLLFVNYFFAKTTLQQPWVPGQVHLTDFIRQAVAGIEGHGFQGAKFHVNKFNML
jgi:hypothetical protein